MFNKMIAMLVPVHRSIIRHLGDAASGVSVETFQTSTAEKSKGLHSIPARPHEPVIAIFDFSTRPSRYSAFLPEELADLG